MVLRAQCCVRGGMAVGDRKEYGGIWGGGGGGKRDLGVTMLALGRGVTSRPLGHIVA